MAGRDRLQFHFLIFLNFFAGSMVSNTTFRSGWPTIKLRLLTFTSGSSSVCSDSVIIELTYSFTLEFGRL